MSLVAYSEHLFQKQKTKSHSPAQGTSKQVKDKTEQRHIPCPESIPCREELPSRNHAATHHIVSCVFDYTSTVDIGGVGSSYSSTVFTERMDGKDPDVPVFCVVMVWVESLQSFNFDS